MNRHQLHSVSGLTCMNRLFSLGMLFAALELVQGQVTVASNPANGATGVSPSAPVTFSFSGAVRTNATTATFYSLSPPGAYPAISVWNSTSNLLTCTPSPAFPSSLALSWIISGQDAAGNPVSAMGSFTTGSGSGNTGSGTNAITSFIVGKVVSYDQYSNAPPLLDPNAPYVFTATTSLASNLSATSITLTLPAGYVSNLLDNFTAPENWFLTYVTTSSNAFNTTFPQGNYTFFVSATASNQTVLDPLPASMDQPPAPQVTNYTALQSVNVSQPFTIYWNPWAGGAATDFIYVTAANSGWQSPPPAAPGALNGLATSVTIPANTLSANTNFLLFVGFYHATYATNGTWAAGAYRATTTRMNLTTVTAAARPTLANAAWSGSVFGFDVNTSPTQTVTVIASTNCALPLTQWQALLVTNSPGSRFHFSVPASMTNKTFFYGAHTGP